jgi:transposase
MTGWISVVAGMRAMKWLRIRLSEVEQEFVKEARVSHSDRRVRRRLETLWLLHCGVTREKAAQIVGVARSTVEQYVALYREEGVSGLQKEFQHSRPTSELEAHRDKILASFNQQPVRTAAEASQRIFELTGIRRGPTQVRKFLKGLGMTWQRVRAIPVPPKKTWPSMPLTKQPSMTAN